MISNLSILLAYATAFAAASPVAFRRAVAELNEEATAEAHQRDGGATRAFSDVQIKTSDGKCLFVDKLSGDFRANLTPIQVADCGSTDGQGWDIITAGEHNDQAGTTLIVSTLTQACFNFDDRRRAGNQVLLFSCGGRADGGGAVTNSQLFDFDGGAGPLALQPKNSEGSCLTVNGNVIDIAGCNANDAAQSFTFGGAGGNAGGDAGGNDDVEEPPAAPAAPEPVVTAAPDPVTSADCEAVRTVLVTVTETATPAGNNNNGVAPPVQTQAPPAAEAPPAQETSPSAAPAAGGIPNPTEAVPVSRAGGVLNPTSAAQSHQFDATATRAFTSVSIEAPNGQCLFIDPTAGDFRQNLIPVSLVPCAGTANEKFDIITSGKHNNGNDGGALIVSSLMNGCISLDGRRAADDTVTIFSCGGRGDGEGETNSGQLVAFDGNTSLAFAPLNDNGETCLVPAGGRLGSAPCTGDGSQVFTIIPVGGL